MSRTDGPVPSPPEKTDPLQITWKAGRRLYRVHFEESSATAFNPGGDRVGRFHPIFDCRNKAIPTLYAANQIKGALSETVFHNLLAGGVVLRAQLANRYISEIELAEDLILANLSGSGLRRLGLNRSQLLECSAAHYKSTARWAEALHRDATDIAGLVWVSRQFDTSKALIVFGDRVGAEPLAVRGEARPLYKGAGYRLVQKAALEAGITIIEG